jgi:hypothetical protein
VCDDCSVGPKTTEPVAEYTVDLGGSIVSDVGCGGVYTCVLLDRGTRDAAVKCFGDNSRYQLVSNSFLAVSFKPVRHIHVFANKRPCVLHSALTLLYYLNASCTHVFVTSPQN